ncbi:recombinase family protein [Streptomyces platensis]|uniref:recombinase family protein n=1 Tax=Streptomyces platensis TaxID=58346 RepID=UPI002E257B69
MTTAVTVWEDFDVPAHARGGQVTLNLYDHLAAYAPKRPGAYLRISSDRFGLEAGVDRQLEDAEDSRSRLRWGPFAKIYRENDTSAFKKRKVVKPDGAIDWMVLRPEFRQLLADLAHGVIDGVIFYDLDRLVRQPRDRVPNPTSPPHRLRVGPRHRRAGRPPPVHRRCSCATRHWYGSSSTRATATPSPATWPPSPASRRWNVA